MWRRGSEKQKKIVGLCDLTERKWQREGGGESRNWKYSPEDKRLENGSYSPERENTNMCTAGS